MKLTIKVLFLLIITIQLINLLFCLNKTNEKLKLSTNKSLNIQIPISTISRTHHYEQAEEAAPGSIVGRVVPIPLNKPNLVSANNWTIPFPIVRPTSNIVPISQEINEVNPLIMRQGVNNYQQNTYSGPPGSQARIPIQSVITMQSPMPIAIPQISRSNILDGGVRPTFVNILKPLPTVQRIGLNNLNLGSEFINGNENLNGIESIEDFKISSKSIIYLLIYLNIYLSHLSLLY
jgi:hypothetical protein